MELANAQPGCELALPGRSPARVRTTMQCREGSRAWIWIFLENGSLLESDLGDLRLYRRHEVLERGTGVFETLVAQDGALVRYEARRRSGALARRPVRVTLGEKEYRLTATGTVEVARSGDMPGLGAWKAIRDDASHNVYFRLVAADQFELVLGMWTDDVCLSFGRVLPPLDGGATQAGDER